MSQVDEKPLIPVDGWHTAEWVREYPPVMTHTGRDLAHYFDQVARRYKDAANPFWYYEYLVDGLRGVKNGRVTPLNELFAVPYEGKRVIGLRHDVDADPLTALRCARLLARKGMGASFYLLHTAPYYGDFFGDYFIRNPELVEWVKGLIVTGCEIGVHNDSLGVYVRHGRDGAEALKQEIKWLRAVGAVIKGTVAHNCGAVYGAESYEIFADRRLWERDVKRADGKMLPLGLISHEEAGLAYEGSFAWPKAPENRDIEKMEEFFSRRPANGFMSDREWLKSYFVYNPCCDWAVNYQFWLVGRDEWVAAGRTGDDILFECGIGMERVMYLLNNLPVPSHSMVIVCPEYVRGSEAPVVR